MAKNLLSVGLLFWLAALLSGFSKNDLRQNVQRVYTSQVGIKERTGNNDGKEVKKYLASCKLPEGYEWCSAFVSWVYDSAGVNTLHTAWAPAWYNEKNLVFKHGWANPKAMPKAGDLVLYYNPYQNRIGHVGFFDTYGTKYCETVEGNTGLGNDQGVHRIKRYWNSFFAIVNRIDN
jgi:hypothetical protein